MTINWDVPEGYKKLAYSVGTRGVLNRLLCLKTRDLTKQKIKAKVCHAQNRQTPTKKC